MRIICFSFVQSLISEEHYASSEIESRLRGLEEEHSKLHDTWKKRQSLFSQCYKLQVFLRDAEQRDGWIGTQEAFLANEDLGVRSTTHTGGIAARLLQWLINVLVV